MGKLFKGGHYSRGDTIESKQVFTGYTHSGLIIINIDAMGTLFMECLVLTVAISQTWDLMISWSDNQLIFNVLVKKSEVKLDIRFYDISRCTVWTLLQNQKNQSFLAIYAANCHHRH